MREKRQPSIVLAIGGSDPSGGAGIQADIKTFQSFGVYGLTAVTAVTIQNTSCVREVFPLPVEIVTDQIRAVIEDCRIDAVKIGMLATGEVAAAVAKLLHAAKPSNIVLDPIIEAHAGRRLLSDPGLNVIRDELIPIADVVTPNLDEAAAIVGRDINGPDEVKQAARDIWALGAKHVLIKGGHASGEATDILFDGNDFLILSVPRLNIDAVHGTGCTMSSAIAAGLAAGKPVAEAVINAKKFTKAAIEGALSIGKGRKVGNQERGRFEI